jgi:TldD protein
MLEPVGLDEGHLNTTLGSMMQGGVDYADLYFQVSRQESWSVEDRIIREGSFSLDQGVGVRAVSGEKTGFAYSDELILPALENAASAARAIARQGETKALLAWNRSELPLLYPAADPTTSISDEQKTTLLAEIEAATRALDSRVEQVMISLSSNQDLVLVASSDGTLAADIRPLVRMNVSVILDAAYLRQGSRAPGGGSTRGGRSPGRHDAGRSWARLARHPVTRSRWSWSGRRLQSQRHIRVFRQSGTAGRQRSVHDRRRRHDSEQTWFPGCRR